MFLGNVDELRILGDDDRRVVELHNGQCLLQCLIQCLLNCDDLSGLFPGIFVFDVPLPGRFTVFVVGLG